MILTPQDIQSQQFHVRFRGFDVEEVDTFLERVAEDFLTLVQENKKLHEKLENLDKEISGYHKQEKSFQSAIIGAQQIVEEMKNKARLETEELLKGTRDEAKKIADQANDEIFHLEKEIDRLRNLKAGIQEDLRRLLHSYLDVVDEKTPAPEPPLSPRILPESTALTAAAVVAPLPHEEDTGSDHQEEDLVSAADIPKDEEQGDFQYEKIDISEEMTFSAHGSRTDAAQEEAALLVAQELEAIDQEPKFAIDDDDEEQGMPSITVPDLEGDMIFTLDDPLDDHGPSIKIVDDDAEEDK